MDAIGDKKISIVTVCYNAEQSIEKTIMSVINQRSMKLCEYLVKDGNSYDATEKIVRSYEDSFAKKGISFAYYAEADTGIYNAMNNSLNMCHGDWILFMNAGDRLYDNTTLQDILKAIDEVPEETGVVYGDTVVTYNNGKKSIVKGDHTQLYRRSSICHQSCLVRSDHLKKLQFDEKYRLLADRELLLRLLEQGIGFHKIERIICNYEWGGVSNQSYTHAFEEKYQLERQHCLLPDNYSYKWNWLIAYLKDRLTMCFPWIKALAYFLKNKIACDR